MCISKYVASCNKSYAAPAEFSDNVAHRQSFGARDVSKNFHSNGSKCVVDQFSNPWKSERILRYFDVFFSENRSSFRVHLKRSRASLRAGHFPHKNIND